MIRSELLMLAASFGFGGGIVLSYALCDLIRGFFLFGKPAKVISELLYWTLAGMAAFWIQFQLNDGIVRLYSVMGAAAGLFLFHRLVKDVYEGLTRKVKRCGRIRKIRRKKRRKQLQNSLKMRYNQVKIKLNSLRTLEETEENTEKEP